MTINFNLETLYQFSLKKIDFIIYFISLSKNYYNSYLTWEEAVEKYANLLKNQEI